MNILLIAQAPAYPLHLAGCAIVYHLATALQARGHLVDLLAFAGQPSDWQNQYHYADRFRSITLIAEPTPSTQDYLNRMRQPESRWPRQSQEAWSPEMWQAIEARLDAEPYDAVQMIGSFHLYEYFHALRELPAIFTPYDSYGLLLRRSYARQGMSDAVRVEQKALWMVAQAYEQWMFAPYTRTVAVTDADRNELVAANPALRVDVIPLGVDLDTFRLQLDEREPATLVYVGNYEYGPNLDAALWLATEILPRVRQRVPDARLILVGNGPPPELRALATESIIVTGRVPAVQPYLARSTVFVSPIRYGAGLKNKILEALAMGCPVVATPMSVDGIAVTDGHDVLIADGDGLADATARVLCDAELRQKLSTNGRALIEARYRWAHIGALYETLYEKIRSGR